MDTQMVENVKILVTSFGLKEDDQHLPKSLRQKSHSKLYVVCISMKKRSALSKVQRLCFVFSCHWNTIQLPLRSTGVLSMVWFRWVSNIVFSLHL